MGHGSPTEFTTVPCSKRMPLAQASNPEKRSTQHAMLNCCTAPVDELQCSIVQHYTIALLLYQEV